MMQGIRYREGETWQTWSVMVVAFLALFSQIGVMVLQISPDRIKQERCVCAQIKGLEEGNRQLYLIDTEYS